MAGYSNKEQNSWFQQLHHPGPEAAPTLKRIDSE